MRNLIVKALLVAAFAVAVAISDDALDKDKTTTPRPTSYEEPTTTEISTTTEEPTTKPDTTTTTHKTTTTTTHKTTTTTTHKTTTIIPTTTTTSVPTTTTALPPIPPRTTWNVTEGNTTCILLEAGIRMKFNYFNYLNYTTRTKPEESKHFSIDIPANATANGTCDNDKQKITLTFFEDEEWNITLTFRKNVTTKKYDISHIEMHFVISTKRFPGAWNDTGLRGAVSEDVSVFNTDENKRYMCVARQILFSRNESAYNNSVTEVSTYNLQVEAFRNSASGEFSNGSVRCSADEVSQLVPIIVGAVLAGLIVIVLIAYLIGRRRSRRGYESV